MKSQFNKIVDDKGRVHIPHDLRQLAGIQENDVVRMCAYKRMVFLEKIEIKEEDMVAKFKARFSGMNVSTPMPDDAVECYILAALGSLERGKLQNIKDCLEDLLIDKR